MNEKIWTVYIVRCADRSLYTGVTTDISRRLDEHNRGQAAKYTRMRRPVLLVYTAPNQTDKSTALIIEAGIKKLSRAQKEHLILLYQQQLIGSARQRFRGDTHA